MFRTLLFSFCFNGICVYGAQYAMFKADLFSKPGPISVITATMLAMAVDFGMGKLRKRRASRKAGSPSEYEKLRNVLAPKTKQETNIHA